jgi:hypothetical protein
VKLQDVLRTRPNGDPVAAGTDVEIRLLSDDTLLDTVQTDADGVFTYESDANPGPVYYTFEYGGETRVHSTQSVMPVDGTDLSALRYLFQFIKNGVIQAFPGYPTLAGGRLRASANGTNMQVTVAAGAAIGYGIMHVQATPKVYTVPANTSGSTRTDSINLRFFYDEATKGQTYVYYASGYATYEPDPNQALGYVEIPLAQVTVDNGVTAIASGKVSDLRVFCSPQIAPGYVTSAMLDPTIGIYPQVHNVNLTDTAFSNRPITVGTAVTCISSSVVLPTGSWSGQLHYEAFTHPGNATTATITGTWDATTANATVGNGTFINWDPLHTIVPLTNVSGTKTVTLKVTLPTETPASGAYITGARIYGTLIRTA